VNEILILQGPLKYKYRKLKLAAKLSSRDT